MNSPVLIKSDESIWEVARNLLEKSDYFRSHLSGRLHVNQMDPEFDGYLSNYIYFLKHKRIESRITGDHYCLALYLGNHDYLQLCDEVPKIRGYIDKMLRHNHKLTKIWSKLD